MKPKPIHLSMKYAEQFQDESVAAAYRHRPEYPPATFEILAELIRDEPRNVLDTGCGTGFIARRLADTVDRMDAVDPSAAMIVHARQLPGGDSPRIRWIVGSAEDVVLEPPYALIVAGQSLHWMEWDVVMRRFLDMLSPQGQLSIVEMSSEPLPWEEELLPVIARYSTNRDFQRTDLVAELKSRDLFSQSGHAYTNPVTHKQPVDAYIEAFHARNGFSRERMLREAAEAFDRAAYDIVSAHCPDGVVHQEISGHVVWGRPGNDSSR